jgi:D-beta-D-heptose 7-phosphate kinase/D-beta-D-heptose 1-phosphate adenosyltransferase
MKEPYLQKIKDHIEEALGVLGQCKNEGKTIVFTNGCFDLLHSGHIQYLNEARELGDFLVLGINDDDSVKRLKGENRPILPLRERMEILSGLQMVDLLIPFSEDTPLNLIENVKPDVLVKGGDYQPDEIVGYDFVIKSGGQVKTLSFKDGASTTNIIEKILKIHNDQDL